MTNSTARHLKEKHLYLKTADSLRAKGVALPAESDDRWDRDTLSGYLLNLFRLTNNGPCFDAFYRLNVKRLVFRLSRSPYASAWNYDHMEMAADIFHDIFHAAHTFSFRGGVSFRAWLRVITRNKIRKALRNRSSLPTIRLDYVEEIRESVSSDPLRLLIHRERTRSMFSGCWLLASICAHGLRHAITNQEEEVLRLHESEGLSYKAIARRLEISLREVVCIGRRGRRKVACHIRRELGKATRIFGIGTRDQNRVGSFQIRSGRSR